MHGIPLVKPGKPLFFGETDIDLIGNWWNVVALEGRQLPVALRRVLRYPSRAGK